MAEDGQLIPRCVDGLTNPVQAACILVAVRYDVLVDTKGGGTWWQARAEWPQ